MTDEPKKRGGSGRGQGRKPIKSGEATVPVTVRMVSSQKEKLQRLGGSPWVRKKIDDEKE